MSARPDLLDGAPVVRLAPGLVRRLGGAIRLVHPFPSLLDGAVVALIATVAGARPDDALRIGLSMTALQAGIGALNDVVDAPHDAGRKPGKPIPAGLVGRGVGAGIAGSAAVIGLALAVPSGADLAALGVLVLGIGAAYDLRLKGTAGSWIPFAAGVPLLPVYAWLGATGGLPVVFGVLVPVAAAEGAALAVSNAVVDLERDREAGVGSVALRLGPRRSALVVLLLQAAVAGTAVGSLALGSATAPWVAAVALAAGVPLAGAVVGLIAAWRGGPASRELAWEIQAVGAGLLAVAWLGGLGAAT